MSVIIALLVVTALAVSLLMLVMDLDCKREISNRRRPFCRLKYLLWHSDMEVTRFTLGISALFWALFLAWPGDLFPLPEEVAFGKGRMTYAIMAQIMPENAWACLWAIQGSVMLWSLFSGVRGYLLMVLDPILGVMLWTVCVGSAFVVYWPHAEIYTAVMIYKPPAAMAGEIGMIMASWWVLVRYRIKRR